MAVYHCVLFDLDGTLLDFTAAEHGALMETLEHFAKVSLVARQLGGAKDLPMDKIQECCEIGKSFPIRHPGYRKYH